MLTEDWHAFICRSSPTCCFTWPPSEQQGKHRTFFCPDGLLLRMYPAWKRSASSKRMEPSENIVENCGAPMISYIRKSNQFSLQCLENHVFLPIVDRRTTSQTAFEQQFLRKNPGHPKKLAVDRPRPVGAIGTNRRYVCTGTATGNLSPALH